ncbi:MAG: response regulator [Candidatus Eisenbacteria bacterium]|nr:response regulator [Candidatus Eisenbacteria bacterium]
MTAQPRDETALPPQVLLIDENEREGAQIQGFLQRRGYHVYRVTGGEGALNVLDRGHIDAVVTQLHGRRTDGLRLLQLARRRNPGICVILLAAHREQELATRALSEGAYDYQTRPLNLEKMDAVIRKGLEHQRLSGEVTDLTRRLDRKYGFHNILGNSAVMMAVFKEIQQATSTQLPVLLLGEAGTGKDLIASTIHHNSPRRGGPFVRMSCEALADEIMDRELFGWRAPQQAGVAPRKGRFEIAAGGTLYLDGVGNLSRSVQEKLAERLEASGGGAAGARVVASTSEDLEARLEEGLFSPTLYTGLGATRIELPPLRQRRGDIPILIRHFVDAGNDTLGTSVSGFTRRALDRMAQYDWPGNVRELKNMVTSLVSAKGSGRIDLYDLPLEVRSTPPPLSDVHLRVGMSLKEVERTVIRETLARYAWDRRQTARILGIGLRTLYRKIKEYDLRPPIEEPPGEPPLPK